MDITKLPKDREECAEQLRHIVQESLVVNSDQVTDNASFAADLGADSLDFIELVMEVEGTYGITVFDDEVNEGMTFSAFVSVVYKHLKDGGAKS